jgi:arginyl-tRNA synthetase
VLHLVLEKQLQQALAQVLPGAEIPALPVRPCPDPRFGDYQTSVLMSLAKERKINPRALAADVLTRLETGEWCEAVEIAGAGFLNFRLKPTAVARALHGVATGRDSLVRCAHPPRTIVLDFSSPNVAKPMHIGHIRSTILGDCLARTFRFLGHRVITDNHLGDWGTQFGKLLVGWKQQLDPAALERRPLEEMERLYKTVHTACETDPAVLEQARQELVRLQNGDPENLAIWRKMIALSQAQFDAVYQRLGVRFDFTLGESFYNPRLKSVVQHLRERGLAQESEGAIAVFFPDTPELKDHPALIQKSDGAANYTTTDLATLEYRLAEWRPDEILYVTDGRQQLHFKQIFTICQRWQPACATRLVHVWFGAILGADGKPFKTRSGEVVRLSELLDEAEERAFQVVTEKSPERSEADRRAIARIVGLGAIKYADLLPNRQSDYVFSWDKMLAFNGNTAPYLLYAYTRIRSIFRKQSEAAVGGEGRESDLILSAPEELRLAKHLLHFGLVIEAVAEEARPNYLCNYLFELAGLFSRFFENCPVLKSDEPVRSSRLVLCRLTGQVLKQGLEVLGLETTEQM